MRVFYRLVKLDPPSATDFPSHHELGRQFNRPLDPESARLSRGVSVSENADKLRARAAKHNSLGKFIATLHVTDGDAVRWEQTTKRKDHYTLWGTADEILACVERVDPL